MYTLRIALYCVAWPLAEVPTILAGTAPRNALVTTP